MGWWKQRDLTIIGKVHLLKTYALSKLNYVSSSLIVPNWVFRDIEKICFEFLWGGKDRIKRDIMYQDISDGGLKMINFKLFVKTQRVMWIKRLLYEEQNMGWKLYFDQCFKSVGGRLIFLCNYDADKMDVNAPPFYEEIIRAWQELENCRNFEQAKFNPIVFNNKNVLRRGKMIFNEQLFEHNIYRFDHICDEEGMRTYAYFQGLGLSGQDIVNIWSLYDLILKTGKYIGKQVSWQNVDLNEYEIMLKISQKIIRFRKIQSRKVYGYFVKNMQHTYSLKVRDGRNNFDFSQKMLSEIFVRPRITTIIAKLREFQFKLLHGVIYTKMHLFRFGFAVDNLCSFCNREIETYSHLFWECARIKQLWKAAIEKFKFLELRNIEWKEIHVGITGNSYRIKCCNCFILIMKYTIYTSRSNMVIPSLEDINKISREFREGEKEIAVKRGILDKHVLKWEKVRIML